jgi:hypothetical protein
MSLMPRTREAMNLHFQPLTGIGNAYNTIDDPGLLAYKSSSPLDTIGSMVSLDEPVAISDAGLITSVCCSHWVNW